MNTVTLQKDGSMLCGNETVDHEPLRYLGARIELETDYTLKSFFLFVEKYKVFQVINPFLPTLLQQFRTITPNHHEMAEDEFLEFGKTVEMIGFPGKPRLEIFCSLKYMAEDEVREVKKYLLEALILLPLRLGNLKHIIFGDKVDILDFETVLNLFEFLDGMAWELSFHGAPVQCALRR
ncbi:MAG: hypothetical protein HQK55_08325 [Deltaproteobacteria bacterium]|nr:hypothetical protein [Deltaproteobacteria bacterium]